MLQIALAISCGLLLGTGALAAWLGADRKAVRRQRDQLSEDLAQQQTLNASLQAELHSLEKDIAVARETQRGLEKHIDQAHKQLREAFQSLAGETLKQSTEQFLAMAKRSFESEQKDAAAQLEQRKQAIEGMLKPVRESLEKYNQSLQQIESARKEAYGGLKEQLGSLVVDQRRLRKETASLVTALRRPEGRGRWGEMQLKRVAEIAGMIENCDFTEQSSVQSEGGRLRPDMKVMLPGGRTIIVDAKTPFDAFINAVESADEDEREKFLQQHVNQIETQVSNLARKEYQAQFERTPDFVVMFIPGESFLQPAVQRKPDLLERAMNRGVVIATPSTLISLLKVVALGWREQQIAENAKRISELGQELHERIATATGHVERLGKNLEAAVKSYNQFVGSFETRVLSSARKFKELGADSSKELPADGEVKQIEAAPREVRS